WLMMSLWDALRMNMMISYQELVRTFLSTSEKDQLEHITRKLLSRLDQMEEEGVLADSLR
ncbi:hypothetical protein R1K39_26500, partial [Klebsiella sp. 105384]